MRLVVISGRSGSGKTVALHTLEDMGFYCIDNLPITFLPELEKHIGREHPQVAVSIDARNVPSDLSNFKKMITEMNKNGEQCEIIYLDTDDNTLLKRFSETRRKHPLTNENTSLREAIRKEHALLTPIADLASLIIDTSHLERKALPNLIRDRISQHTEGQIQILLQSFGFKYGLPPDADFVFDVRCLPNPYWETELRSFSGLDSQVITYLENQSIVKKMLSDISTFLEHWIPRFKEDNRSYMTIAIGCTGGKHRSVFLVEKLAEKMRTHYGNVQIRHRELRSNSPQSSSSLITENP